ncbi:MAG: hypothetical protein ACFCU8_10285 [Thermosynechococcaceae cyanobacterium]
MKLFYLSALLSLLPLVALADRTPASSTVDDQQPSQIEATEQPIEIEPKEIEASPDPQPPVKAENTESVEHPKNEGLQPNPNDPRTWHSGYCPPCGRG